MGGGRGAIPDLSQIASERYEQANRHTLQYRLQIPGQHKIRQRPTNPPSAIHRRDDGLGQFAKYAKCSLPYRNPVEIRKPVLPARHSHASKMQLAPQRAGLSLHPTNTPRQQELYSLEEGKNSQGDENDSGSKAAEDRSGYGSRGAAGKIVEAKVLRLDQSVGGQRRFSRPRLPRCAHDN